MSYTSQPLLRVLSQQEIESRGLPRRTWFEFERDFACVSVIAGTIVVPQGFLTDRISASPDVLYALFIHDLLTCLGGELPGLKQKLTRSQCAAIVSEQAGRSHYIYYLLRIKGFLARMNARVTARKKISAEHAFMKRGIPLGVEPD